jgi:hypothetical protein
VRVHTFIAFPGIAEDCCAGRASSVKAHARESGDLRSALIEFAPALHCHYPGQARVLKANSKAHSVLLLPAGGDILLRRDRLPGIDLGYMRAVL